jgi:hypothetical protein
MAKEVNKLTVFVKLCLGWETPLVIGSQLIRLPVVFDKTYILTINKGHPFWGLHGLDGLQKPGTVVWECTKSAI